MYILVCVRKEINEEGYRLGFWSLCAEGNDSIKQKYIVWIHGQMPTIQKDF